MGIVYPKNEHSHVSLIKILIVHNQIRKRNFGIDYK